MREKDGKANIVFSRIALFDLSYFDDSCKSRHINGRLDRSWRLYGCSGKKKRIIDFLPLEGI